MATTVKLEAGIITSINQGAGVAVGTAIQISNNSMHFVRLRELATEPEDLTEDFVTLTPWRFSECVKFCPEGSLEIWAQSQSDVVLSVESV